MGLDLVGAPGTWFETHTGKHFDPVDPKPEMIDIGDIAHSLSMICRYNGHCKAFYSVAEHSVRVAAILPAELKLAGLLHDAAETYTGDMIRPMKRVLPEIREIEDKILRVIFEKYGLSQDLVDSEQVKEADNILIATELRDLMSGDAHAWEMCHIAPLTDGIKVMPITLARAVFLKTFEELKGA